MSHMYDGRERKASLTLAVNRYYNVFSEKEGF